ncbi:MAG: hypothetical protein R2714_17150 [Microthrixaceae bacterium]
MSSYSRPLREDLLGSDRSADQAIKGVGDRSVALPGRALVAESGFVAGVTEAVHELLGAGAGARSERAGKMAEVVEVEIRHTDLGTRFGPCVLEHVWGKRPSFSPVKT